MLIANWKMAPSNKSQVNKLISSYKQHNCTAIICPPYPYIPIVLDSLANSNLFVGAQECSTETEGAYTGEVSAKQLADIGVKYVLVGHSERRQRHNEDNQQLSNKLLRLAEAGIHPILCIGESDAENKSGKTEAILATQLSLLEGLSMAITIAYEPVWAIGTGRTPTPEQANEIHKFIKAEIKKYAYNDVKVLYGGSVNAGNAKAIFEENDIDGALVGGASLKAEEFISISRLFEVKK